MIAVLAIVGALLVLVYLGIGLGFAALYLVACAGLDAPVHKGTAAAWLAIWPWILWREARNG